MANIKFEDLFTDSTFAEKVFGQLLKIGCIGKDGKWKGISGNKMEIVAALDALENLNVFKPKKHTVLAKVFCQHFHIKVGDDIAMVQFYHTPPLKDYHRFRGAFKELLEKHEKQVAASEREAMPGSTPPEGKQPIDNYLVIKSEGPHKEVELQKKVVEQLKKGYEPLGGVAFDGNELFQAMVKYRTEGQKI